MTLFCPLCSTELKQHLLQPKLAIIICTNQNCMYPFNMSMEEIKSENLIFEVNSNDIMYGMRQKLMNSNVDSRIADFMSKEDDLVD